MLPQKTKFVLKWIYIRLFSFNHNNSSVKTLAIKTFFTVKFCTIRPVLQFKKNIIKGITIS